MIITKLQFILNVFNIVFIFQSKSAVTMRDIFEEKKSNKYTVVLFITGKKQRKTHDLTKMHIMFFI
jgi:hypothetical protein